VSLLWPSIEVRGESAAVIVGGKVFRVIDGRWWDATRRFDDMAAADDVDVQVVSPMRQLLLLWFPPADTDGRCGFIGIRMVPTQDASLAGRRSEKITAISLRHIDGITLGRGAGTPSTPPSSEPG